MQSVNQELIIQHLKDCEQSQSLNLSNHNIEYVEDLGGIRCRLQKLNVSNNRLSSIENLKILTNLRHLNLSYNNLSNINGLENLSLLEILLLNNNKIQTVSSLQPLRALKQLKHLTIYNNPICSIPHFSLIIKQIISKTTLLDQYTNFNTNFNTNSFSDPQPCKLEEKFEKLEHENKRLKTNIEALQRVLIIHENSLEKCANNNQKFDFKEWRQIFIEQLISHETFLKKELKIKQSLKNDINTRNQSIQTLNNKINKINKENETLHTKIEILSRMKENDCKNLTKCREIISNNMLSINTKFCENKKKWNYKINEMNTNIEMFEKQIILIQKRFYQFVHKTTSEKQNLFKQYQIKQGEINTLRSKYENEKSVKQFYSEQIVSLTKHNKKLTNFCEKQREFIEKQKYEIKNQSAMIENYQSKVSDLINKFFKIKQVINIIKNEQNDINTSIKITLKRYLNEIDGLKSNLHLKNNQIICFKTFQMMETKKLIKKEFDVISNFYFKKYHIINEKIANINSKIENLTNEFENVMDITEKKEYVLIQQINALQLEKDQLENDDEKDESEEEILLNNRRMPRQLQCNNDNDDNDSGANDANDNDDQDIEKYNHDHINKLEKLLKLTKSLLDESEEEKIVKQILEN